MRPSYHNIKAASYSGWLKKTGLFIAVVSASALLFFFFYMLPRHTVPVLMYHSISDDKHSSLTVSPDMFNKQMQYLNDKGYSVISLDEFVCARSAGRKFSRKEVVITFDDGYEDNFTKAFPVLFKYNMPAIIFLEASKIGKDSRYLTWDQVRLMAKNSISFGSHTNTGAYLPPISDDEVLMYEISDSKQAIETQAEEEVKYFCYPIGGFNARIKSLVKQAGYKGACATNRGFDMLNEDVYEINRIKVSDSDMSRPFNFRAKLSGYYNLFRKGKSPD